MRRPVSLLSLALAAAGALVACQGDGPDDDGPDTPARVNGPISDWPTRVDAGLSDPTQGPHDPGMPGGSGPAPGSAGGTSGGDLVGGGTAAGGLIGGATAGGPGGGATGGGLGGVVTPPAGGTAGGSAGPMDASAPLPSFDAGTAPDAGQADAAPDASSDAHVDPG